MLNLQLIYIVLWQCCLPQHKHSCSYATLSMTAVSRHCKRLMEFTLRVPAKLMRVVVKQAPVLGNIWSVCKRAMFACTKSCNPKEPTRVGNCNSVTRGQYLLCACLFRHKRRGGGGKELGSVYRRLRVCICTHGGTSPAKMEPGYIHDVKLGVEVGCGDCGDRQGVQPDAAEEQVADRVFEQAYIPRRLEEVQEYERDHDRLAGGDTYLMGLPIFAEWAGLHCDRTCAPPSFADKSCKRGVE